MTSLANHNSDSASPEPASPAHYSYWLTGEITASERRILAIILLLGLAVRLMASYLQPAFLDEGFVYQVTKAGFSAIIDVIRYDTHPPTYNLLMYPLVQLTSSIFILRLPAVLLSLGTILLSFKLCRRFVSSEAALASAAFVALSYNVWLTDAQLRNYGPLMLLLTLLWLGMLDIRSQGSPFADCSLNSKTRWALWALVALLTSSLHVLGSLCVGTCLLLGLTLPRRRCLTLTWLALALLPTIAWFLWGKFSSPLGQANTSNSEFFYYLAFIPLNLINLRSPESIIEYLRAAPYIQTASPYIIAAYLLGNAILWAVYAYGWYSHCKRQPWEANLLGLSFLLPLLIIWFSCLLGLQPFSPRYAITLTVPFLLTFGAGLRPQLQRCWYKALLIVCLAIIAIFPFWTPLWNQCWKGTLDFIERVQQPGDFIGIYHPYAAYAFAMDYAPEDTRFTFTTDSYYHAHLEQREREDRLPLRMLSNSDINPEFYNYCQGRRLILILCQKHEGNNDFLVWLINNFDLLDYCAQPSLTYWADNEVFVLRPKRESFAP